MLLHSNISLKSYVKSIDDDDDDSHKYNHTRVAASREEWMVMMNGMMNGITIT